MNALNEQRTEAVQLFCSDNVQNISLFNHRLKIKILDIKIDNKNATAICQFRLQNASKVKGQIIDTLDLAKENVWKITNINTIQNIFSSISNGKKDNTEILSSNEYQSEAIQEILEEDIILSDRTLIPIPHTGDIFEINSTITNQQFGIDLFSEDASIDAAAYYNTSDGSYTIFTLDPYERRIIYAKKYSNGSYSSIKGYGCHAADVCKFQYPGAIDVNQSGEIFVVDFGLKKIFKLQYSSSSNSISCNSSESYVNESYLSLPVDIDFFNDETGNDDYFVIADIGRNSILQFDANGDFVEEYSTYSYTDYDFDIQRPIKLCAKGAWVGFIDGEDKHIVFGLLICGNIHCVTKPFKIPASSNPVDIGLNWSNMLFVVDNGLNMCHKFSCFVGEYICSYNGFTNTEESIFVDPVITPNFMDYRPNFDLCDIYVNDKWSASSGFRRFYPGADAVNVINTDYYTYHELSCVLTDPCYYYVYLFRYTDNSIVYYEPDASSNSCGQEISCVIDKNQLEIEKYRWAVYYKPLKDDEYGEYSKGWKYTDIVFNNYGEPLSSSISSDIYLDGNYYCNGTTIEEDVTVTVVPGTTILFNRKNSSKLASG